VPVCPALTPIKVLLSPELSLPAYTPIKVLFCDVDVRFSPALFPTDVLLIPVQPAFNPIPKSPFSSFSQKFMIPPIGEYSQILLVEL